MIVTIQQPLSREVFWHIYAKIPRHTSKNAITEGDFKCIFARNCEGTEQLHLRKEILLLYYHAAYLFVFQYTARRSRMTGRSERRATLCGRLEAILRSDTYVDFRECQLTLVNISRSWWLAQNDSAHVATF